MAIRAQSIDQFNQSVQEILDLTPPLTAAPDIADVPEAPTDDRPVHEQIGYTPANPETTSKILSYLDTGIVPVNEDRGDGTIAIAHKTPEEIAAEKAHVKQLIAEARQKLEEVRLRDSQKKR